MSEKNPYNATCPTHGDPAIGACRCPTGHYICPKGHEFPKVPDTKSAHDKRS